MPETKPFKSLTRCVRGFIFYASFAPGGLLFYPRLGTAEGALCYTWANLEGMCQNMDYFFLDHSVNELSIFVHRG